MAVMGKVLKHIMMYGASVEEAREMLDETMDECRSALDNGDIELAEDIFKGDTGLEPEYMYDLI